MSQPAAACLFPSPRGLRLLASRLSFTLIELLIAAAIAGLLLAVVFAVYGSLLNTVALQNRWRDKIMPGADALDCIVRDLACAVAPFGVTNRPFAAVSSEKSEEAFKMSFYSAFPAHSEASAQAGSSNDWRGYSIGQVSYSLRGAEGTEKFVLVRECGPFRVPSPGSLSAGREKWRGIKKMEVSFFNGSSWTNQWGGDKDTNALPQAARIRLVTGQNDQRAIGTEVLINAGRQIVLEKLK